jgi:hypothetical protein
MQPQVGSTPIPFVREHKTISEDIDEAYKATIYAASEIRTYLLHPKGQGGNRNEVFLSFYRPFNGLFMHTRHSTTVKNNQEFQNLTEEIDKWFKYRGRITIRLMEAGLDLFERYQKEILQAAIIMPQRG